MAKLDQMRELQEAFERIQKSYEHLDEAMQPRRIITISGPNEETVHIDVTEVERYTENLEARMAKGKFFTEGQAQMEALNKMDERQLRFLASSLTHLAERYAKLWMASFSPKHAELVKDIWKVKEMAENAGFPLWPEIDEQKGS